MAAQGEAGTDRKGRARRGDAGTDRKGQARRGLARTGMAGQARQGLERTGHEWQGRNMSWEQIYEAKGELEAAGHKVEVENISYTMSASCSARWRRVTTYVRVDGETLNASRDTKSDDQVVEWMHATAAKRLPGETP